jgi:hypothetical protein
MVSPEFTGLPDVLLQCHCLVSDDFDLVNSVGQSKGLPGRAEFRLVMDKFMQLNQDAAASRS